MIPYQQRILTFLLMLLTLTGCTRQEYLAVFSPSSTQDAVVADRQSKMPNAKLQFMDSTLADILTTLSYTAAIKANASTVVEIENTGPGTALLQSDNIQAPYRLEPSSPLGDFCSIIGGATIVSIASHSHCSIIIVYNPQSLGSNNTTFTLNYTNSDGLNPQSVALSLSGQSLNIPYLQITDNPDISPAPDTTGTNFGSFIMGVSAPLTKTLTVTNVGTESAEGISQNSISWPYSYAAGSTCDGISSLAPNASCIINVTYTPTLGESQVTMSLTYSNGAWVTATPYLLDATGVDSSASLTLTLWGDAITPPVDFGSTPVGEAVTYYFTLSNSTYGMETSSISIDLSQSGPNQFITYNNCSSLGSDDSCTIAVTFLPTFVGVNLPARLNVHYTYGSPTQSGSPISVALQGTSIRDSSLSFDPATLNFGYVMYDTTADPLVAHVGYVGADTVSMVPTFPTGFTLNNTGVSNPCNFSAITGPCNFGVSFSPISTGTYYAYLSVSYTDTVTLETTNLNTAVLLTGSGKGLLHPSILGIPFGYQVVASTTSYLVTFPTNTTGSTINFTLAVTNFVAASDTAFSTSITSGSIAPGLNQTFEVLFNPKNDINYIGTVLISYVDPISLRTITENIALTGTGTPPMLLALTSTPENEITSVPSFGTVVVNSTSAPLYLTLTYSGADVEGVQDTLSTQFVYSSNVGVCSGGMSYAFCLSTAGITNNPCPADVLSGATTGISASCNFEIIFSPTASHSYTGTFQVQYSDGDTGYAMPNLPNSPLTLTGTGGSAASLTLQSPSTPFTFSAAGVGESISQAFTLVNSGATTATMISASDPGAPYSLSTSTPCGGSLNGANSTCTFWVTFEPSSISATFPASFSISYNNGTSTVTMPLINLNGSSFNQPISSIAVGGNHTCMIVTDGAVQCWGRNNDGQLGIGSTTDVVGSDMNPPAGLTSVTFTGGLFATSIAAGYAHTCAILNDNSTWCWGNNSSGQLGTGSASAMITSPSAAINWGTGLTATSLSLGYAHTCAILSNNTVKCLGGNSYGQLGLGDMLDRSAIGELGDSLLAVDLGTGKTAQSISASVSHTCALLNDNSMKCWGAGLFGELGQGSTSNVGDLPGEMGDTLLAIDLGTSKSATQMTTGYAYSCAVLNDGSVKCWGLNAQYLPDPITPTIDTWQATGSIGTCWAEQTDIDDVIRNCFSLVFAPIDLTYAPIPGYGNAAQEMGDNNPVVALGEEGQTAISLSAGSTHTCSLFSNGDVKCWGGNAAGQLGIPDNILPVGINPTTMGDSLAAINSDWTGSVVQFGSGGTHSCVLLNNDSISSVYCWGGLAGD